MAFSRNSLVAAVAGSVSLAILSGCPNPVTPGTNPSASPSTGTSASPATSASPGASTSPAASTSPGASVSPSTVPSQSPLEATTVRGFVYDSDGARVTAAKVRVRSLNPSSPFDSTVDVVNGAYVVNSVPAGVNVEISAQKEGWTTRTRVESLLPLTANNGSSNEVNFGGSANSTNNGDAEGPAYFIAEFPEVVSTEPAEDATNVNPSTVSYKLTLSESLDSTNQRRFADAIRLFPANSFADAVPATSGSAAVDLEPGASTDYNVDVRAAYFVDENSTFLGDDDTKAKVVWDADGKTVTLTFGAPLLANEDENTKYQVGLVADQDQPIEDKDGNNLGTNSANSLTAYPTDGRLINNVFREPDLAVPSGNNAPDTEEERWDLTHDNVSTFEVAEDETEPTLTGVNVTTLTGPARTRISLTFNEPMAAYGGANNGIQGTAFTTAMVSMAIAETTAKLDDVSLDGDDVATEGTSETLGDSNVEREREFRLIDNTADITFSINPDDPKTVRMEVANSTLFANEVNAIKVRVEGMEDPAGNAITDNNADKNQKVGTI